MIRTVALCATIAACCLNAAPVPQAPLAVYYSFDNAAPSPLFTEMQSELGQILADAGVRVAWRPIEAARNSGENFPAIAVLRFRGQCFFDRSPSAAGTPGSASLGATDLTEGHMLSFGNVNCDAVRVLIGQGSLSMSVTDRNAVLGRALARVTAHEIYHMLTGSKTHASDGIAKAAFSRGYLTAPTFAFARPEMNWLRSWVEKQAQYEPTLASAAVANELPASGEPVVSSGR